jgi:hypothetical protein
MSKLFAMAVPILPGKTEQWKKFSNELKGSKNKEFLESRKRMGVQERSFLQHTPMGDLVIVTIEGKDPQKAFEDFAKGTDEFAKWFNSQVKEIHGVDLSQPPAGAMPELIVESEPVSEFVS